MGNDSIRRYITEKEVPNSDWNQNDSSKKGYIENRPFYVEHDKEVVSLSITREPKMWVTGPYSLVFTEGKDCTVVLDDVTYNLQMKALDAYQGYIGNAYLINTNNENTGEPFCIYRDTYYGYHTVIFENAGSHVISLIGMMENIALTSTKAKQAMNFWPTLIVDEIYKIVWEGTEYNLTCKEYVNSENKTIKYIGNLGNYLLYKNTELTDGNDTGEPFCISNGTGYSDDLVIYALEGNYSFSMEKHFPATNSIKILSESYITQTLDLVLEPGDEYTLVVNDIQYDSKIVLHISNKFSIANGTNWYNDENFCKIVTSDNYSIDNKEYDILVPIGNNSVKIIKKEYYNQLSRKFIPNIVGVNTGLFSEVFNDYENNTASGMYSHAEGSGTTASGMYSHAEGSNTTASGSGSHAEGYNAIASSTGSHAEGSNATASGVYSHAEGLRTTASGQYSHAEGSNTTASGSGSHAEGYLTDATAQYSHAEGFTTKASGSESHSEGRQTIASGYQSHAEGYGSLASGSCSHAEGGFSEIFTLTASGEAGTTTYELTNSIDESYEKMLVGAYVVLGYVDAYCTAVTKSDGKITHFTLNRAVTGSIITNAGFRFNVGSVAAGNYSHAEGENTVAASKNQHTQGKYNIIDTETKYAHIVGNGSDSLNRSNAHTVDWSGNAEYAGDVIAKGCGGDSPISLSDLYTVVQDILTKILPTVTTEDNGKVLQVVDGKWAVVDIAASDEEVAQMLTDAGLTIDEESTATE